MRPLKVALKRIEDLRRDLSAEIVLQEERGHYDDRKGYQTATYDYDRHHDESYYSHWVTEDVPTGRMISVWIVDQKRIAEPDNEKREKARNELRRIYDSSNTHGVVKYATAKLLDIRTSNGMGCYPLRIWTHEHPIKATIAGIGTAGAVSGLVYALVEYFSK